MADSPYVPALGAHWLTPLYDPLVALFLREKALKGRLLEQASIAPGHDVLDVGCGTGTLAILAKQRQPAARVVGLDVDPRILAFARRKIAAAGLAIELREARAESADAFAPGSFDRIVSSFALHHLTLAQQRVALAAARRWLRPGGELHVLDFAPHGHGGVLARAFARRMPHGHLHAGAESLAARLAEVGFARVEERGHAFTPFGTAVYTAAVAPTGVDGRPPFDLPERSTP